MIEKKIKIVSKNGLHARPASSFVKKAMSYVSTIYVIIEDKKVNAKNILEILSLGIKEGAEIVLNIDGEDEIVALAELERIISAE